MAREQEAEWEGVFACSFMSAIKRSKFGVREQTSIERVGCLQEVPLGQVSRLVSALSAMRVERLLHFHVQSQSHLKGLNGHSLVQNI
jgi:hypothetical protein